MILTNYHSHSSYSDGTDSLNDFVESAIKSGVKSYGFSEHAPVTFDCEWCMPKNDLTKYSEEIDRYKILYSHKIDLFKGLEIDYIPSNAYSNLKYINALQLDYFIGAIHFVDCFDDGTPWGIDTSRQLFEEGLQKIFSNDIKKTVERYYMLNIEMLEKLSPPIIAHLDKIAMYNSNNEYFNPKDNWYRKLVTKTLGQLSKKDTIMELNTRGFYKGNPNGFSPSPEIIYEATKLGIPLTVSSDCHSPNQIIFGYDEALKIIKDCG